VNLFGTAVMSKCSLPDRRGGRRGLRRHRRRRRRGRGDADDHALGAVNALAGSFTVALSVAVAVIWMTRLNFPSPLPGDRGGVIGWNLFTGSPTDGDAIVKILGTWISSPVLAGIPRISPLQVGTCSAARTDPPSEIDAYTRAGLIALRVASLALGVTTSRSHGLFVGAIRCATRDHQRFSLSGTAALSCSGESP